MKYVIKRMFTCTSCSLSSAECVSTTLREDVASDFLGWIEEPVRYCTSSPPRNDSSHTAMTEIMPSGANMIPRFLWPQNKMIL